MNETVLAKGKQTLLSKLIAPFLLIAGLLALGNFGVNTHHAKNIFQGISRSIENCGRELWRITQGSRYQIDDIVFPVMIYIFVLLPGLIMFFWLLGNKIVVTNMRVYGRSTFCRRVDIPLDSISAVTSSFPKAIKVSSSSGTIKFLMIDSRNEVHKAILDLLIERQNKKNAEGAGKNENEADKLREMKKLLDEGIITQEEFEAKKKQLLGL